MVDCQVSEWTPWSECDKSCGTGVMLRTRKIIRAPQNGGKHCPSLTQKRSCQGIRCHSERGKRVFPGGCKFTFKIIFFCEYFSELLSYEY